jgi:predicted nucleic acid-binding protein
MTSDIVSVDTNILIYLYDDTNKLKRSKAKDILASNPKISAQVISEYLNTIRRLLNLPKADILINAATAFSGCDIIQVTPITLLSAAVLTKQYHFQLFDAVIVASVLESGCNILYSEDMHHGLLVNKKLKIINPFL